MPEEVRTEVCNTVQEAVTKTIPPKKKGKKTKWLSEEGLQRTEKRREMRGKWEREIYMQMNAKFQRRVRRDCSPQWTMQRKKGKQKNGKN